MLFLATVLSPVAAAADNNQGTINVTGHAEVAVVPDVATVTTGVVTTGADVEAARSENDRTMRRIVEALISQGIDRSKIATSQFSLQPLYRSDGKEGSQGAITGYRLSNSVTVTVDDLDKVGSVIDAAFAAGANQFQGLRFGLKDDSKLRDELLNKAIQDGKRKAAVMADALGVTLGKPVNISESGRMAPIMNDSVRLMKFSAGSTPVEAGTIILGIDVNMSFAL
jgi:uncharacterized protein YggE